MTRARQFGMYMGLVCLATTGCSSKADSSDGSGDTSAGSGADTGGSGTETAGGTCPFPAGEACDADGDCVSGTCEDEACVPADLADGQSCTHDAECQSGLCLQFQDAPVDPEAVCTEHPPDCNTRFAGRVLDFTTQEPIPGIDIKFAKALAAATGPAEAMGVLTTTADGDGNYDVTSEEPLDAALGMVALIESADHYLTATGVAEPADGTSYAPGSGNHDMWAMQAAQLTAWSELLDADPDITGKMLTPLGDRGGVIGLIRDNTSGDPVAGAEVRPVKAGGGSIIRYLSEDGSAFTADATSMQGIFVLLAPGLAEEFDVYIGDARVSGDPGIAGSAGGAAFTLVIGVDP